MRFQYDTRGVKEQGSFELLPKGKYVVRIDQVTTVNENGVELKTKNGDPMVRLRLVVTEGDYKKRKLWHNVSFIKPVDEKGEPNPGAGMAKHFLKVIGEGQENEIFEVNTAAWEKSNSFVVTVDHEDYQGKTRERVKSVDYLEGQGLAAVASGIDL